MSKREKKKLKKKKQKKWIAGCEHKSDVRTAAFIEGQLDEIQDRLADLIADMRTFEHYGDVFSTGLCLTVMQSLKKKYRKIAEGGGWPDS